MLNALAMIIADEFLDLAMFVLTFVKGDADLVVRGCHGAAEKTGRLSFYVEITNLAEIEDLLNNSPNSPSVRVSDYASDGRAYVGRRYCCPCWRRAPGRNRHHRFPARHSDPQGTIGRAHVCTTVNN